MSTNTTSTTRPSRTSDAATQLSLLPNDQVSARFQLSKETRERGLRHVAEIRAMLAERTVAHGRAA